MERLVGRYIEGADRIWLADPFLAQPHQLRNLLRLLELTPSRAAIRLEARSKIRSEVRCCKPEMAPMPLSDR